MRGAIQGLVADCLKPGQEFSIDFDDFREHCQWSHPQSSVSVVLSIDDQFFTRFAMASDSEDNILMALVMAVTTFLQDDSPLLLYK